MRTWAYKIFYLGVVVILIISASCGKQMDDFFKVALVIEPTDGSTTTIFDFHVLDSSENSNHKLFIRWDFENDSSWNTQFSNTYTESKRFLKPGSYQISAQVMNSAGEDTILTGSVEVVQGQSNPIADFTIEPDSGNFLQEFIFDACKSFDYEDSLANLFFRWDIGNDGIYDTPYSHTTILKHVFGQSGRFEIKLEVKDHSKLFGSTTKYLFIHTQDTLIKPDFNWHSLFSRVKDTFHFDASSSHTQRENHVIREFQWQFPYQSVFNESRSDSRIDYVFDTPGNHVVTLRVIDNTGLTYEISKKVYVDAENGPPIAILGYAIPFGNTKTNFYFHTWNCSDDYLSPTQILKRWDFDGDGFYDTQWTSKVEAYYNYAQPGNYNVKLQIKDDGGNYDSSQKKIIVSNFSNETSYFIDQRDREIYGTVKIGNQWWMAENLKYRVPKKELSSTQNPYQYLNEDKKTLEDYGLYYNIGTSIENRMDSDEYRICPNGWRIPSIKDWNNLWENLNRINPAKELAFGGSLDFNASHTGYVNYKIDMNLYPPDTIWEFNETYQVAWFMSSDQHADEQRSDVFAVRLIRETEELWQGYVSSRLYIPVRCIRDD